MITFGNPETFALQVSPLAGAPPEGDPSGNLTWSAMRMIVQGRNLFRHVDVERAVVNEDVSWPVIGLARWFIQAWDAMFHTGAWAVPATLRNALAVAERWDTDLAFRLDATDGELEQRDEFVAGHALRSAAGGAALPDCWFSRDGDIVSVAWSAGEDADLAFQLTKGEADVPAADFALAVRGFVDWVARLLVRSTESTVVVEDRRALTKWLNDFASPQAAMRGLLSEAGISPTMLGTFLQKADAKTAEEFFRVPSGWSASGTLADARHSVIAVAFRCVSPILREEDLLSLRQSLLATGPSPRSMQKIRTLAASVPPVGPRRDYLQGYLLARGLRRARQNRTDRFDVEALLESLAVPVLDLSIQHEEVDGGCICDEEHGPAVFVNPLSARARTVWGRRMVLAHELCHLLFDRSAAVPLAVLSGPWAPPRIERRANAFAAELLLPLEGIEDVVRGRWYNVADEDIQILMDRYGLGVTATTEHVRNLRDLSNR